jgi:hypothetical protein
VTPNLCLFFRRYLLFGVAVLVLCTTAQGNAQEVDIQRTLKELRAGQERLSAMEVQIAAWTCEGTSSLSKTGSSGSLTVKRLGESILGQAISRAPMRIFCKNSKYVFAVEETKVTGTWAVISQQATELEKAWSEMVPRQSMVFYPLQAQGNAFTTLQMLRDPEFKPKGARNIQNNRVELDYEYEMQGKSEGNKIHSEGTLVLATDLEWLVVKSISRTPVTASVAFPTESVMTRVAVRDGDLIRVTSSKVDNIDARSGKSLNWFANTYKYLSPDTVDPAEFDMEFYGPKSPVAAPVADVYEDRPSHNWPLWGGIGLGCIIFSAILAWFVRRRKRD